MENHPRQNIFPVDEQVVTDPHHFHIFFLISNDVVIACEKRRNDDRYWLICTCRKISFMNCETKNGVSGGFKPRKWVLITLFLQSILNYALLYAKYHGQIDGKYHLCTVG